MDESLRNLERLAANGGPDAKKRLAAAYRRAAKSRIKLPTNMKKARRRSPAKGSSVFRLRPNRNVQRLRKHLDGECSKDLKCRFCRRSGPPLTI